MICSHNERAFASFHRNTAHAWQPVVPAALCAGSSFPNRRGAQRAMYRSVALTACLASALQLPPAASLALASAPLPSCHQRWRRAARWSSWEAPVSSVLKSRISWQRKASRSFPFPGAAQQRKRKKFSTNNSLISSRSTPRRTTSRLSLCGNQILGAARAIDAMLSP